MPDTGFFVLDPITAERTPATDPDVSVTFLRADGREMLRARNLEFPPRHRFSVPSFPLGKNLRCQVTSALYKFVQSEFFTLKEDETHTSNVLLIRDPARWQPAFTPWKLLPNNRFSLLKTVLGHSFVKTKHGPDIGSFTDDVYDDPLASAQILLAKMALLNLFAVLMDTKEPIHNTAPWFTFVQQILVIDRERFIALVDPQLWDIITAISNDMGNFKTFFPGETGLHVDNIPSVYTVQGELLSVKSHYEHGNVQFTLANILDAENRKLVLLDCDMDENSNVILHLGDVFFRHPFTGGTDPVDIHEFIVFHDPGVNLGYLLTARAI